MNKLRQVHAPPLNGYIWIVCGDVWIVCGPVIYRSPHKFIGDDGKVPVAVPDAFFMIVDKRPATRRTSARWPS